MTVALATPLAPTEKSGPVPASATICGLPVALSLTEIAAPRAPIPVGVKVTLMSQFALGGSKGKQSLVCAKSPLLAPVTAIPEMTIGALPVFVSVTFCRPLVVPAACCAKVSVCGTKLAVVAPAEVPTVSVTTCWWVRAPEVPTMSTG